MTNIPLSERPRWIGSSESAVLLGCSPYNTPFTLWHEKAGSIAPENLDAQERIQAGRFLEPAIAAWAAEKWDDWRPVNVAGYLRHPTVAGMGASLDFEDGAVADPAERPPIEIKNVDALIFRDEWVAQGEVAVDAPIHFLIQVQHQLACRPRAPYGWLLACVGGNRLCRMRVDRHPGVIARLEEAVDQFWLSVRAGAPPTPDFTVDGPTIAALHPAGNGEILDLSGNNRFPELCADHAAATAMAKAAKARADAALAELRQMIGNASGAIGADGWRVTVSDIRPAEVPAHTRAGYRRFNPKRKEA